MWRRSRAGGRAPWCRGIVVVSGVRGVTRSMARRVTRGASGSWIPGVTVT